MTFMARHGLALVAAVTALIGHSLAAVPRPRKIPTFADHPERGDVPGWVMITLVSSA
jgi:hypothetical protein